MKVMPSNDGPFEDIFLNNSDGVSCSCKSPNKLDLSNNQSFSNSLGEITGFHGFNTKAIRSGYHSSQHGEHSEAIYETSSYIYSSCEESFRKFSGLEEGNVYSRFTNPTVRTFEKKLALLELADDAIGASSGMAAILTLFCANLKSGDKLICSAHIFGSTRALINNYLCNFGINVVYVGVTDYASWEREIKDDKVRMIFLETPANPTLEVVDLSKIKNLIEDRNIIFVVDNTVCTPCSQRPLLLGSDIVIHSTSKYIDGHGRCIGGAIAGNAAIIDKCRAFMRCAGPSMTAHNAWIFIKGLETLDLRMERHSHNAQLIAEWMTSHPRVKRVMYPGLPSHPNHLIAAKQQKYFGGLVSFEIDGPREEVWRCVDKARVCSLTTNIGDAKTMITHPASTTHVKMTSEQRMSVGISDSLVRLSVGLENVGDLIEDLSHCFA